MWLIAIHNSTLSLVSWTSKKRSSLVVGLGQVLTKIFINHFLKNDSSFKKRYIKHLQKVKFVDSFYHLLETDRVSCEALLGIEWKRKREREWERIRVTLLVSSLHFYALLLLCYKLGFFEFYFHSVSFELLLKFCISVLFENLQN